MRDVFQTERWFQTEYIQYMYVYIYVYHRSYSNSDTKKLLLPWQPHSVHPARLSDHLLHNCPSLIMQSACPAGACWSTAADWFNTARLSVTIMPPAAAGKLSEQRGKTVCPGRGARLRSRACQQWQTAHRLQLDRMGSAGVGLTYVEDWHSRRGGQSEGRGALRWRADVCHYDLCWRKERMQMMINALHGLVL